MTIPRHPVRRVSVSQSPSKSASSLKPEEEKTDCLRFFCVALAKYGIPFFAARL